MNFYICNMTEMVIMLSCGLTTGILVAIAVYFSIGKLADSDRLRWRAEQEKESNKTVLPLKIQAYERLILLCERISVNALILRLQKSGMSSKQLQMEMVKTIRAEFDHNIAQQLYVSSKTWESIKTAKEETIKAINIASSKVKDESESMQLISILFEIVTRMEKMPTEVAIEIIKNEARSVI